MPLMPSRRSEGLGRRYEEVVNQWIRLMAPIVPHVAEELWSQIGGRGYVSTAKWPETDRSKINQLVEEKEEYLKELIKDISKILRTIHVEKPRKITIFVAPEWKYKIYRLACKKPSNLIEEMMKDPEIRSKGKAAVKIAKKYLKQTLLETRLNSQIEFNFLQRAKKFIMKEFNCDVSVVQAEHSTHEKAEAALPLKPGIMIE